MNRKIVITGAFVLACLLLIAMVGLPVDRAIREVDLVRIFPEDRVTEDTAKPSSVVCKDTDHTIRIDGKDYQVALSLHSTIAGAKRSFARIKASPRKPVGTIPALGDAGALVGGERAWILFRRDNLIVYLAPSRSTPASTASPTPPTAEEIAALAAIGRRIDAAVQARESGVQTGNNLPTAIFFKALDAMIQP